MYKQNVRSALSLSSFELLCLALVTIGFGLAGIARPLLQRFDLISSTGFVQGHVGSTIQSSLHTLDNLAGTAGVVTFLTWAVVGLVVCSVVQAVARANGILQLERDVSSNRYVHPSGFSRKRFWRNILSDTLSLALSVAVFIAMLVLLIVLVIPTSIGYLQDFVMMTTVHNLIAGMVGLVAIFANATILFLVVKLMRWHYRLSRE